jgi:adenylosuccinate lyase
MAYKRNPMRCERATGLSRWLIGICTQPLQTAAEQWFERTLDDSANKRLAIPEAFLTADACLRIVLNVTQGLVVRENVITRNFVAELPYMATENILMSAVQSGGDRQTLHERIRVHSLAAAEEVNWGRPNDLLDRLQSDPALANVNFDAALDPRAYVGRSPEQVNDFLTENVAPVLEKYAKTLGQKSELNV